MSEDLEVAWLDANLATDFKIIFCGSGDKEEETNNVTFSADLSHFQKKDCICKAFSFS